MNTYQRIMCPECRCKLLKLDGFEGVSSRDAPGFDRYAPGDFRDFGLWVFVWDFVKGLFGSADRAKRRQKAKQLRNEILPEYPKSVICPDCFWVEQRK